MTPLLRLLGYPVLEGEDGRPLTGRATQRHRLALLAVLGSAGGTWSRDKLLALLWPESSTDRARNSLNESLYVLRGALGDHAIVSGTDELRLAEDAIRVDAREMEAAVGRGDHAAAVAAYRGPFLDGFFVSRSPEFEQWAATERDRLARLYEGAIEQLALTAWGAGDALAAAALWRRLAASRPYDSRVALQLMRACAAAGDRAGALDHARAHVALLRADFAAAPPPELTALEEEIRAGSSPASARPSGDGGAAAPEIAIAPSGHSATPISRPAATAATVPKRGPRVRVAAAVLAGVIVLGAALTMRAKERSETPRRAEQPPLAVLPFQVLTSRAGDDFLALGIPDAVITRLASTRRLRVRPTSAIVPFDGAPDSPREVARKLAAPFVLTGVVERGDSALTVSVQLFGEPEGAVVWRRDYRVSPSALPLLADSVAAGIVAALLHEEAGPRPATGVHRADPASYELFMRGRAKLARHREQDTREAVASFERAIAADSQFALAHAGLAVASAEMHLRFSTAADAPRWAERALREAEVAFALDSALPEVHEALAAVHRKTEFDWSGTIAESRKALRLDPGAPMPYFYMGGALYHVGLLDEAERVVREGLQVQPVGDRVEALRTLGTVALADGRYAEAVALLQDVQRLSDHAVSDPHLAAAYFYAGDTTRSIDLLQRLLGSPFTSAATRARALLASILARRGERERARALLSEATRGTIDHHVAYSIGATYAQLGEAREALRWLRAASITGFQCYPWYARDPLLAPVRHDHDFAALLASLRTQWESDRRRYAQH